MPQPIQFTPLEVACITCIAAILSGLVVAWFRDRSYMTREECCRVHQRMDETVDKLRRDHEKTVSALKESLRLTQRMVRALVVHSNIPPEQQEEILNDRKGASA